MNNSVMQNVNETNQTDVMQDTLERVISELFHTENIGIKKIVQEGEHVEVQAVSHEKHDNLFATHFNTLPTWVSISNIYFYNDRELQVTFFTYKEQGATFDGIFTVRIKREVKA